jgi:outer membrane protein OmpA-like peptidoglycan-associated protein
LFIKGDIKNDSIKDDNDTINNAKIEIKNINSKKITEIPVDKEGKYVAALVMKDDYVMTVKKKGCVYDTKYFAKDDTVLFNEPQKIDINIEPIKVGNTYKLNDIYFETNSYIIKNESKYVIDEFITFLNENPKLNVIIQGHTDDIGSEQDNLILSENRAKAVYNYLIENGIDKNRLNYKGYGKTKPVASNQTEEGRAKNRRTEFLITQN